MMALPFTAVHPSHLVVTVSDEGYLSKRNGRLKGPRGCTAWMDYDYSGHVTLVRAPTPDNSVCLNFSVLNEILLGAQCSRHGFVPASTFSIIDDDMAEGAAVRVL